MAFLQKHEFLIGTDFDRSKADNKTDDALFPVSYSVRYASQLPDCYRNPLNNSLCMNSTETRDFSVFGFSPAFTQSFAQRIAQSIIIFSLSHRDSYVLLIPALDLS